MSKDCDICDAEDCEPDYVECCDFFMCDFCRERHDGNQTEMQPAGDDEIELLTREERRALGSLMDNAEHDAGDVEDTCPRQAYAPDAYWAWHTYHGLRKLLMREDT